jgi:6-phosphogluconate dehydrogenase
VRDILMAIAARADDTPCCAHLGSDGAGHFVKMLHNGIEYADMQMIAEVYYLLRHAGGLDLAAMQAAFRDWNAGELGSYLIEITADILGTADPETGQPMLDVILDRAGQKGTGQWASVAALELGVPAPTIAEAVAARALSARRAARLEAAETYGPLVGDAVDFDRDTLVTTLRDALLAAKVCAYAQGFAVLAAARQEFGWQTDLGEVARIWRGGCIIRARFLDRIAEAFGRDAGLENLLHDAYFAEVMRRCHRRLRAAVSLAAVHGLPAPALASALAYFDACRSGRLWADMLQAQRDYFGAHTFERVDRTGRFHFPWTGDKAGAA